jgi:hypothetical protein
MKSKKTQEAVAVIQTPSQNIALTDQVMAQGVLQQQAVMVAVEDIRAKWQAALHVETAEYNRLNREQQALMASIEAQKSDWIDEMDASGPGCEMEYQLAACTRPPVDVFGAENKLTFSLEFTPVVTRNDTRIDWKVQIWKESETASHRRIDLSGALPALPGMVVQHKALQAGQDGIDAQASKVGKLQHALSRLPEVKRSLEARAARLTLNNSTDGAALLTALSAGIQTALPPEIRDLMA